MSKRVVIAAGGTGGHLFPAQGLASQLLKKRPDLEILFVAGGLKSNRNFDRDSFNFEEVQTGTLLSLNPFKCIKGWFRTGRGIQQSMKVLKNYKADLFVGFGSFHMVPPLIAAKILKIPTLLHVADCIPGKANRFFAPFVDCVGVHFPQTIPLIKGRVVEVGLPLRPGYEREEHSREAAARYFNLDPNKTTLLIFGGSQGAKAINKMVQTVFKGSSQFQVIHITGQDSETAVLNSYYQNQMIRASVKTFEHKMNLAWSAADAFIGRSGASTIAEAMEFEVPGILIPYPFAADNHQEKNADFFVDQVSGGLKLLEASATTPILLEFVDQILNENWRKHKIAAIKNYKQKPTRLSLCDLALKYL